MTYFSSARARRIGAARPNSLNEVKKVSFLYGETAVLSFSAGGIAGFLKTSRVARVVGYLEKRKGGAKFVLMSFVHAARKPETGSFHPLRVI